MEPPIGTTRMIFTGSGNIGPRTMTLTFRSCGFIVGFLPTPSPSRFFADGAREVGGAAASHPCVHLWQLALPQTANSMGRQPFVLDPAVYGISGDAQVCGDFVHGVSTQLAGWDWTAPLN